MLPRFAQACFYLCIIDERVSVRAQPGEEQVQGVRGRLHLRAYAREG